VGNGEKNGSDPAADGDEPTPFTTGDELLQAVFASGPAAQTPLAKGQLVADVYEIVERIGAGGMGVVYLARDRQLARNVALKLIRTPSSTSVARLVREAQAIAQLSHPNVVTVFEIGTHDGQPFVAMEYVDGGTARTWIAKKPRTWREIVALYVAAGRGLEAAHRAQLIHRDFKPDNVLVGDDGRVRVADFGVVQSETWPTIDGDDTGASSETITKTGTVMGTPAYMAPEQRRGTSVDKAADQFAFAMALWEALTGARPFANAGTTIGAPKRPLPRHVEVALRRALAIDPAERWPSMAPLLAELSRDPHARRRRIAWVAGGLVATAAIVTPLAVRDSAPEPCTDSDAIIASTWGHEQRTSLVAALGPQAGATVGGALDQYASTWAAVHRTSCRDTRVTRSQSEDMLDRRMQCLFSARDALDATVSVLRTADAKGRARAQDAIARLPGLDRCGDIEALARQEPLPTDPTVRKQLDEASRELAAVHVAEFAPKRIDRMERADAALALAREVGWRPLIARALLIHAGQLFFAKRPTDAIRELHEAISLAIPSGLDDVAATAFAELAILLAETEKPDAATIALMAARAHDDAEGPAPMLRVLRAGSVVAARAQRHDEAIDLARQFVARVDKSPTRTLNPMTSRHHLAQVLGAASRLEDATKAIVEAIAWGEANYGADHAEVGSYRAIRASYSMYLGKFDEAIAEATAGLAVLEKWYGPDSVHLTDALMTLGDAHMRAGRLEAARPYLDRALVSARNGDDVETIATVEALRADFFMRSGDLENAALATDGLVTAAEKTGNGYSLRHALLLRGILARDRKRNADSERDLVRALESGKGRGEVPDIQNLRNELARTWVGMGRAAEARDMLERQVPLVSAEDVDPILRLETHVVLAAALFDLGDKPRARMTIAVADRIAKEHPDRPDLRALVDGWHAKYR
jgi:tetratricopeptide (TPR) repeat protein